MPHPSFDDSLNFDSIDFRQQPELYRVGKGEQGVLLVEPYKSEILPHWRFRTPEFARESADAMYQLFLDYQVAGDFIGMDMARKFLQMGYTRARRYANVALAARTTPQAEKAAPGSGLEHEREGGIGPQLLRGLSQSARGCGVQGSEAAAPGDVWVGGTGKARSFGSLRVT